MNIKEAEQLLKKELDDNEGYHSTFDTIIEERLSELDPEFMVIMRKLYNDSGLSRWY